MSNAVIYMDYAAATPVDERVFEAMKPYFTQHFQNPSSVYLSSRAIKEDYETAKADVAHWLGARPSEIIMTAGATEANNLALSGVLSKGGHAITSAIEHEAILSPIVEFEHTVIGVDARGMLDIEQLTKAIQPDTKLVSVMYANNEIGCVQHLSQVAGVIVNERENRRKAGNDTPILFHSDASQAPNYLDLHVDKLGLDLMTINGGKIYGPKQTGALYVRAGIVLDPILRGGGQERGLRSGTENVAGAVGLAAALRVAQKLRKDEAHRLDLLSRKLRTGIEDTVSGAELLGHKKHRLPNITSVCIPGIDGERVVMMLDEAGIEAATGSACGAMRDGASHVVQALGKSEDDAAATLRFSLGRMSSEDDVDTLLSVLPKIVNDARSL